MSDPYGRQGMPYGMPPNGRPSQVRPDQVRRGPPPDRRQNMGGDQYRGGPRMGPPRDYTSSPSREQQWPLSAGPGHHGARQQPQRSQRPAANNGFLEPPRPMTNRNHNQLHFIPQYADPYGAQNSPTGYGAGVWNDDGYAYPSPNSSRPVTDASMTSSTLR